VVPWHVVEMLIIKMTTFYVFDLWVFRIVNSQIGHCFWNPSCGGLEPWNVNISLGWRNVDGAFPSSMLKVLLVVVEFNEGPAERFHPLLFVFPTVENIPMRIFSS